MRITTDPARPGARTGSWRALMLAVLVLLAAMFVTGFTLSSGTARAAEQAINQCNGVGPGATGATTALSCTVTVVNTIDGNTQGLRCPACHGPRPVIRSVPEGGNVDASQVQEVQPGVS